MPYWTSLCVLRVDKSSLYEILFHCNILSKHHHLQSKALPIDYNYVYLCGYFSLLMPYWL
jgi:hypothetical protein